MDQTIAQDLRKALAYLKAGNPQAARPLLVDILKRDPEVEQAWYMLSFAVPNEERQIYAINQALQLNPYNEKAKARLEKLTGSPAPTPPAVQESPREEEPPAPTWSTPAAEPAPEPEPEPEPEPKRSRSLFSRSEKKEEPEEAAPTPVEEKPAPAAQPEDEVDLLSQRLFGGGLDDAGGEAEKPAEAVPEPKWAAESTAEDEEVDVYGRDEKPKKKKAGNLRRVLLIALFAVILVGGGSALYFGGLLPFGPGQQADVPDDVAAADAEPTATETTAPTETDAPTFTAEPTETEVATSTAEPTMISTYTPGPTATMPPVDPQLSQAMAQVQIQVIGIRGTSGDVFVTSSLVPQSGVQEVLLDVLFSPELSAQMENEERVLRALGLSDPGYSMDNHTMNTWVESTGGLYDPLSGTIRVAGLEFGGLQRYTYAFEFAQALTNLRYDMVEMGFYPGCSYSEQQCRAMMALIKGDAALVQEQWLSRNGSASDREAVASIFEQPFFISEPYPPAFAEVDLDFPYVQGLEFVRTVFSSGGWGAVDEVYLNPPTTTEQILHPQAYLSGEEALEVNDQSLGGVLGDGWREIKNDSLGEWRTFLILAYGKDAAARLPEDQAADAAEGWGGNQYQVYHFEGTARVVMVSHWVWDSPEDAVEFSAAMTEMLSARFGGEPIDISGAMCWQSFDAVNCLISLEEETIWVTAPNEETASILLGLYPTE